MTATEFIQKKINPRITAEYDISLTGQQLFDLLDEYAAIAEAVQPETTDSVEIAKDIIANIYSLMGKYKNGADMDLSSATDAMYRFIKTIE